MRITLEISDEQVTELKRLGKQANLSLSELVRGAIGEYLQRHEIDNDDVAFGLFRERPIESIGFQNTIRSEWHTRR